ncbi:MAG: tyrosinase family protein [Gemmatimonadota bacterium]
MNSTQTVWGLMSDPDIAALDPIFYLHHSNIDRMWAGWNANGNGNPSDPNWLNGPATVGEREFAMPMPDGSSWVYTPADVNELGQLDYTYDDVSTGLLPIQPSQKVAQRLVRLGATPTNARKAAEQLMDGEKKAELVGANQGALRIPSSGTGARVRLDSAVRAKVANSLVEAAEARVPDQVYLRLENVRGNMDGYKLDVSVNQQNAGAISLFGLRKASLREGAHGGTGLTFVLDITHIIDDLFMHNRLDIDALDVRIVPNQAVPDSAQITVERVSIYRQREQ